MDEAQRETFARLGYLVIRNAIPVTVLASCTALFDERLAEFTADQLASGAAGRKMGAYLGKDRFPTRDRHGREYDGQRMVSIQQSLPPLASHGRPLDKHAIPTPHGSCHNF